MTIADILAILRAEAKPHVALAGFLVSPDVFAALRDAVPAAGPGQSFPVTFWVRVDRWLPAGSIVPVDSRGMPLVKPKADA